MNRAQATNGFTIIEVILFLAVTSALMVGVLASSQVAVSQQRYRDALTSVQGELQRQYSRTSYVVTDTRTSDATTVCNDTRGTSNCIVLGRLVVVSASGITSSNMLGVPKIEGPIANGVPLALEDSNASNDPTTPEALFGLYTPYSDSFHDTYTVPWGEKISTITPGKELRMIILRSPLTGLTYTYSALTNIASADDAAIMANSSSRTTKKCLRIPRDGFGTSADLGVIILPNSTSAGGIVLMTEATAC